MLTIFECALREKNILDCKERLMKYLVDKEICYFFASYNSAFPLALQKFVLSKLNNIIFAVEKPYFSINCQMGKLWVLIKGDMNYLIFISGFKCLGTVSHQST